MLVRFKLMAVFVAAVTVSAAPVFAQEALEKCYGVALAGEAECEAGACVGKSTVDYQGNAWSMVTTGSCTTMELPEGRMGSFEPLDRDPPK